jgi:hypothetical protein
MYMYVCICMYIYIYSCVCIVTIHTVYLVHKRNYSYNLLEKVLSWNCFVAFFQPLGIRRARGRVGSSLTLVQEPDAELIATLQRFGDGPPAAQAPGEG